MVTVFSCDSGNLATLVTGLRHYLAQKQPTLILESCIVHYLRRFAKLQRVLNMIWKFAYPPLYCFPFRLLVASTQQSVSLPICWCTTINLRLMQHHPSMLFRFCLLLFVFLYLRVSRRDKGQLIIKWRRETVLTGTFTLSSFRWTVPSTVHKRVIWSLRHKQKLRINLH